jgi:uncharacterized membrane protein YgcG
VKRFQLVSSVAVALIVAGGALGLATPAFASPALASTVDDFTFSSFDGLYTLGTDAKGHSIMTVQETLVAQFPDFDQNRGIRRTLFTTYDGHPTALTIVSVTDETGTPRVYTEESTGDSVDVTIATDEFVYGEQTYVITYTLVDVTRFYADTKADELYWDTNGTGWPQSFDSVTATVEIDPELLPYLNGNVDASYGAEGAANKAVITATDTGYSFEATNLAAWENLTFAIGFEPETFVQRDTGFFVTPWPLVSLLGALGVLATITWAFITRRTKLRDAPGRGIVVPEYVAPKGVSIPLAAIILGRTTKITAAQIVALAVSGYLRVVDAAAAGAKPVYAIQFLTTEPVATNPRLAGRDNGPISADELEFLRALFGNDLVPGATYWLGQQNPAISTRMSNLVSRVRKETFTMGYRSKLPGQRLALIIVSAIVSGAIAFWGGVFSLPGGYGGAVPVVTLLLGLVPGFAICALVVNRKRLEQKGAELHEHLLGLRDYINWAEADRLNYLQSPQGAERTTVDATSPAQVVKLYERLLPYAILFGLDKQWTEVLGRYYDQTGETPGWFNGQDAFSMSTFMIGVNSITASAPASTTSSSGGSSGGSVSGGGGGGGGGGGV